MIAKTLLASVTIMLLFSATPYKAPKEDAAQRLIPVCHFGRMILIDHRAWPYHQAHGDNLGACVIEPPVDPGVDPSRK